MPLFDYIARDTTGRPQRGTLDSVNAQSAAQVLRGRGWRLLKVTVQQHEDEAWQQLVQTINPANWMPIRLADIELSLSQLGVMLRSGLTLLTALRTVAEQSSKARLRRVWQDVSDRIQEGSSFHQALAQHACFPPLVVQLVRVGEDTGSLDVVVDRAAKALERRRVLFLQVATALAYPAIVLVAAIGVTTFMVVKVIPQLQKFLSAMGRKLPAMTQSLLDMSAWLQANGVMIVGAMFLAIVGSYLFYATPQGRLLVDRWMLKIPIVGGVLRLAATASFATSLGLLLRSGITLLDGLRGVEQLHRNRHIANVVNNARESVLRGGALAPALSGQSAYSPLLARMVAVGEQGGTLDEVLQEVAQYHEGQLQVAIRRLSALIEPAIIIIVGGIVGFVYISFFMALFSAGGAKL